MCFMAAHRARYTSPIGCRQQERESNIRPVSRPPRESAIRRSGCGGGGGRAAPPRRDRTEHDGVERRCGDEEAAEGREVTRAPGGDAGGGVRHVAAESG